MKRLVPIIGAMKSGTSSLYAYLSQHPEIAGSDPLEPNFFGSPDNWAKGPEWYEGLWDWKPEHRIAIEKSVTYSMYPSFTKVFERMATLRERYDYKFIYTIRNPIQRTESHLTHANARNWVHWRDSTNRVVPACEMINVSRYAMQLDQLAKHFDREQVLLVDFRRIKNDTQTLLREILEFLEVERPDFVFETEKVHGTATNLFAGYPPGWTMLREIGPLKKLWTNQIPENVRMRVHNTLRPRPERVQLNEEEKRHIWGTLEEDMNRLESEWGFPTSEWKTPDWWGQERKVPYGHKSD